MLQHENPNVTILNEHLWAVRFGLLRYIPQISYKPDPNIPLEQVPGELSPDGIMILNKDHKYYTYFRQAAISAMKLKPRQIRKELADLAKQPVNKPMPIIYRYCLMAELERRKIMKGGAV
jgi:hypothetical protein